MQGLLFMKHISLKHMTDKQRQIWILRFRKRWRLEQIAAEMGMSVSGVSKMLQRAQAKAGLPPRRVSVIETEPRLIKAVQLSTVLEEY
jgi:RNA polymerase sigma factor (sigma-70 family)